MNKKTSLWYFVKPFVSEWKIEKNHIDHYQHTNNVAYLSRLEALAWEHSASLGLRFVDYQEQDRAMVITQHKLTYHAASHLGDTLQCATWIVQCDKKFRLSRKFQFINAATSTTVFSASTDFVCVELSSGRPRRMPDVFANTYFNALVSNGEAQPI